ncbi:hypothetical protein HUU40_15765 [candidate division KSB1 bacterium]|nr:hypothetical protein [candidate division KSB1 bacterium]
MPAKFWWASCLLSVTAAWAQAQTGEIFLKRGDSMMLTVHRVQNHCLFASDGDVVYLKVVDSVRTSDADLASAIVAQHLENTALRKRGNIFIVDLSQAKFPRLKTEQTPVMIYKSFGIHVSSADIPRYGFQLDHTWTKLPWTFLRLSVGAGLPFSGSDALSSQVGYGIGMDKFHGAVRLATSLNYAYVFDHRRPWRPNLNFPNYHVLLGGGDLHVQARKIALEFTLGLDFRFFESNTFANTDSRAAVRIGVGKILN